MSFVAKGAVLLLLCLPTLVLGAPLCEPVKSTGEGHWPIPEEAFTKERAQAATRELMEVLQRVDGDYLTSGHIGGLDLSPYVLNRLVYIKGFALKSEALEEIAHGDRAMAKLSIDAFCTFLTEEALVWH